MLAAKDGNQTRRLGNPGRTSTLAVFTLLTFGSVSLGQNPGRSDTFRDRAPQAARAESRDYKREVVIRVLSQQIDRLDWEEKPFSEIVKWIRKQGPVNVVPVWRVLKEAGILPNTRCTLTLREVSVAEVIKEAFYQISEDLVYRAIGDIIRISTAEDFRRDMYMQVYNIADLTMHGRVSVDDLRTMIRDTVSPESWKGAGGAGTIFIDSSWRYMLIRNTPEVHEMLGGRVDIEDIIPMGRAPKPPKRERSRRRG